MEIIQFSTKWCSPCKILRKNIEAKYDLNEINYIWFDCEDRSKYSDRLKSLYDYLSAHKKLMSVPTVALIQDQEILDLSLIHI